MGNKAKPTIAKYSPWKMMPEMIKSEEPIMTSLVLRAARTAMAVLILQLLTATTGHAVDRKPNFLFILSDDHRWDAMEVVQKEEGRAARFPWFHSPIMNRLASEGVRFRNVFVTLSLCAQIENELTKLKKAVNYFEPK